MNLTLFGGTGRDLWGSSWLDSAWDPFDLMDDTPFKSFAQNARAMVTTKVDWLETEDAHIFKADLPGLKKEDVKVTLEDGRILCVNGERSKEETKKGHTWHTVERVYGKFCRKFKLPDDANPEAVTAKVEDGVLTVTVPKIEPKKSEPKSIDVA
jgi:HSP20 family protein